MTPLEQLMAAERAHLGQEGINSQRAREYGAVSSQPTFPLAGQEFNLDPHNPRDTVLGAMEEAWLQSGIIPGVGAMRLPKMLSNIVKSPALANTAGKFDPNIPKLTTLRADQGNLRIGFDDAARKPSAEEIKKLIKEIDPSMRPEVSQYSDNIFSMGRGETSFDVQLWKNYGRAGKDDFRLVGLEEAEEIQKKIGPSFFGGTSKTEKYYGKPRARPSGE